MAAAIGFLLRFLLLCLLDARGFQAIDSAGSAEITENEAVLVANPTSNSTSIDAIDESSKAPGPTEDSILEPKEMNSHHSEGHESNETEPEHDKQWHNLDSHFQEELPETEEPREVICSTLETFCKPQDSKTLTSQHHLYSQLSRLLRLLKLINYRPEEEPPHGSLPRWLQEHKRDKYVPNRLHAPHQHQSSQVPQYYASKHYGLEIPERYPHGPHSQHQEYFPQDFQRWIPQYEKPSFKPQSQYDEYLPQDFQRRIPQHEKPSFKPRVHRLPRYMARWTDFLPQRPHPLAVRPRPSANWLQYRQPANMPQMFYYVSK